MAGAADGIIDAHLHIWQRSRFAYTWITEGSLLARDYRMADLHEAARGLPLSGGVLVEAANMSDEIGWLLETLDGEAGCWGVIGWIDLDQPDAAAQINQFAQNQHFKGVRLNWLASRTQPECLHEAMSALERSHLIVDVLAGYAHLAEIAAFIRRYPAITFVLEHFGGVALTHENLPGWIVAMQPFAALPNVMLKISGYATPAVVPSVSCLRTWLHAADDLFTVERLIFGSNYPVCLNALSYAATLARLQEAAVDFSDAWQGALFHDTALKTYRL